jgi:hypothetical protein
MHEVTSVVVFNDDEGQSYHLDVRPTPAVPDHVRKDWVVGSDLIAALSRFIDPAKENPDAR